MDAAGEEAEREHRWFGHVWHHYVVSNVPRPSIGPEIGLSTDGMPANANKRTHWERVRLAMSVRVADASGEGGDRADNEVHGR